MPLGLAATKGLSFTNDWDKDITRLYQREEYAAQVRAEKERKTQFYANLLKKGHASNPRAEQELEELFKGLNMKLAGIVTEHPDLETNPTAMGEFLTVAEQYINNEPLRRDKQVAQEFEKLRNAVSQEQLTPEEWEQETAKYHAYINGKPGDGIEPYVFTNFEDNSIDKIVDETTKLMGIESTQFYNEKTGSWDKRVAVPEKNLVEQSMLAYSIPKKKLGIDKAFQDYVTQNPDILNSVKYNGPGAQLNWFIEKNRAALNIQMANGETDLGLKRAMAGLSKVDTEYALSQHVKAIGSMLNAKDNNGNYIDTSMPAVAEDRYFTTLGDSKAVEIKPRDNVKFSNTRFDLSLNNGLLFKQMGVGKWITEAGLPYLEISGSIDVPIGSTLSEPMKKIFTENGFTQTTYYEDPMLPNISAQSRKEAGLRYTGTTLWPIDIVPEGLSKWSKEHGGQKELDYVNEIYKDLYNYAKTQDPETFRLYYYNKTGMPLSNQLTSSELQKYGLPDEKLRFFFTTRNGESGIADIQTGQFYGIQ